MNVRTCRKCRRLFNYVMGPSFCPDCRAKEEDQFQVVKKYVQEHGRASMQEVAEACDVTMKQIQQWLRDDRLMLADDSPLAIECERCGKMIRGGKFCPTCSVEMAAKLQSAMGNPFAAQVAEKNEAKRRDGDKMRFLNK